ncbi:10570_t:CDS:2 [Funneliformis geosporum]|nr:10570_t:CDS:2 [Funneliformis geosporum]
MHKVSIDNENNESQYGSRNNNTMVVELFKNESDSHNFATSLGFKIFNDDIETIAHDIEKVKQYGFNHIIIIGMLQYGFLFMDCYGRVFNWDDMSGLLWPHGDYSKVAESDISWVAWVRNLMGLLLKLRLAL